MHAYHASHSGECKIIFSWLTLVKVYMQDAFTIANMEISTKYEWLENSYVAMSVTDNVVGTRYVCMKIFLKY